MDVDYPVRVTSSGGRYVWEDDQETPDTQTVCFEFEGRRSITWQGLSCNRHSGGFVTFYGDGGTLELAGDGSHVIYDTKDKRVSEFASKGRGDTEHIANFLAAIRNDAPLGLNSRGLNSLGLNSLGLKAEIADGHKSTLLCHLGNMAHRTGRTLQCDPTNGRVTGDADAMKLWEREYESGWRPSV